VTEGAASNLFIVQHGTILTPPKSNYLLPGVTRDLVLELAQQHGMACREAEINESSLQQADEIWVTSSTKEIVPVTTLNQQPVADGKPGAITLQLHRHLQQFKQQFRS
jgi:D-alanine transaminase